ncbi:hypothetical protein GE09DRAFT_1213516 [Coniochaeta sp. 2T2.1]|nr:hypothetical protein GE09DRAFT_1213516 [Coniochaeta sp. 2T2.1]
MAPPLNGNWFPNYPRTLSYHHWSSPLPSLPQPRPSSFDGLYPYFSNNMSGTGGGGPGAPGGNIINNSNENDGSRGVGGTSAAGGSDPAFTSGQSQPLAVPGQLPLVSLFNDSQPPPHHLEPHPGTVPPRTQPQQNPQHNGQQAGTASTPASQPGGQPALPNFMQVLGRPAEAHQQQTRQNHPTWSSNNNAGSSGDYTDSNSFLDRSQPPSRTSFATGAANPPSNTGADPPRRLPNMPSRDSHTAADDSSEYDSGEDDDYDGPERERLEMLQQHLNGAVPAIPGGPPAMAAESRIRTHQVMRGQMSTRLVASQQAINDLQSVDINSLPESDRSCTICFWDFGVQSPEGVNEAPLRLPWCNHVFGDHCIKRWFKDSNTCPYCRRSVPSDRLVTMPAGMSRRSPSAIAGFDIRIPGNPPGHPHGPFRNRNDAPRSLAPATGGQPPPTRARRDPSLSPPDHLLTPEQRRRARTRQASLRGSGPAAGGGTAAPGRSVSHSTDLMGDAARQYHNYNPYNPGMPGHQPILARNPAPPPHFQHQRISSHSGVLQYTDPSFSRNSPMMPTGYGMPPAPPSFTPYQQPSGTFMQTGPPFGQPPQQHGSRDLPGNSSNNNAGGAGATPGQAPQSFSSRQPDLRAPYGMAWQQPVADHAATAAENVAAQQRIGDQDIRHPRSTTVHRDDYLYFEVDANGRAQISAPLEKNDTEEQTQPQNP